MNGVDGWMDDVIDESRMKDGFASTHLFTHQPSINVQKHLQHAWIDKRMHGWTDELMMWMDWCMNGWMTQTDA